MKKSFDLKWKDGMAFSADIDGHEMVVDANEEFGGQNKGPRPKPLLMLSLAGCTAMDVVSLMKKMRVEFDDFSIAVEGDITDEHPKKFETIKLIYKVKGKNIDRSKVEKAVDMSQERYCGINATLKNAVNIISEIEIYE